MTRSLTNVSLLLFSAFSLQVAAADQALVAHWKLAGNGQSSVANSGHLVAHGVDWKSAGPTGVEGTAATFDGRGAYLELADAKSLALGADDFTVSLWAHTDADLDDVLGDLIGQYDPATRTGWQLAIQNLAGVTNSQPNHRHLAFGIDQGRLEPAWTDHGRVGQGVYVFSLCVHNDKLYASTCEADPKGRGHVYRWDGGDRWTDLGGPDAANAISALASFNGSLYAASSKYRLGGSALAESENPNLGGKVYRLTDKDEWEHLGTLPGVEAIAGLVTFRGQLYASSLYKPAGFFRYGGGTTWTDCGTPDGKRVEALAVYNGYIWATGYDEAGIYRYDGKTWEHTGRAGEGTQTYGLCVHRGDLYVSEWPNAKVFRYGGERGWLDVGRLGSELESMPLVVYNGKMYGGTLPLAEVYRFDGDNAWTQIGRLDHTPDVKYRRAWSMAVFQGRLFCGTLPSGHVHSIEAGKNVTLGRELAPGWRHIAAVRRGGKLELFVDGQRAGESTAFAPQQFDLRNEQPLRIGFGAHDYFSGKLADVRLYRGALSAEAIQAEFTAVEQPKPKEEQQPKLSLKILHPQPWQVIQREGFVASESYEHQPGGAKRGFALVPVRLELPADAAGEIEVRTVLQEGCTGEALAWTKLTVARAGAIASGELRVPAGGWYRLEARIGGESAQHTAAVERFGVGEILIVAGQSYASGANDELLPVTDAAERVSAYDPAAGTWRVANDPQPGHGDGGTIWPPLGDHLAGVLSVPVGFVNVAVGGTASRQWLPGEALYQRLAAAGKGTGRFRAVLWQQGESDVIERTTTDKYVANIVTIRDALEKEWGCSPPWLLAKSTLHPTVYNRPAEETAIRAAIDRLIEQHGFRRGPDTDLLGGENRGGPETRRHFSGIGQRRAALLWFAAVWQEIE
jgi:hypothetical protein